MNATEMNGYLVGVPVAWDQDGLFLPDLFRKAIHKLLQEGCDGLYIFGTSGEGYAVSDDEFTQIVDVFVDATDAFTGFRQVGCFGLSSDQVKNRCRLVTELGIHSVQITLPFWKELNDVELSRYFSDVCGSFPELSFLLYNNPRNKRRLKGKELEVIHGLTPNLKGTKTGSGAWLDFYELITESPSLVHFVTEAAFLFSHGLGTVGVIPSMNYVFPQRSRAYYEAVKANDLETAHLLHKDIVRFFHKTATPLIQKCYIDGAIDKAYARIGGMDIPLNLKSPYIPLSDEDFEWLQSVVQSEFTAELNS
jgi:dihydrodipicolinate synthase/N-acetylneuraminate lyase